MGKGGILRLIPCAIRVVRGAIRHRAVCQFIPALLLLLAWLLSEAARAAPPMPGLLDKQTQQDAMAAIPLDRLNAEAQAKLQPVISQPSIFRQLPTTVTPSDPDLYMFLIRRPEVVVNMWQLMGVTKVQIQRTGDYTFNAADGAGTVCQVELIYGDRNLHIYYGNGTYEGPLLHRLIRGQCVMVVHSDYSQSADQQNFVTSRLDMFVRLDNVGAEILAKTLHPLVGRSADHNFTESTKFLGQVSRAAEAQSTGLQQLGARLTNIDAEVRDEFLKIAGAVHARAAARVGGQVVNTSGVTSSTSPTPATGRIVDDGQSMR